jgi:D-serine deaminase-like pyridoxal phosphate-dependent protein
VGITASKTDEALEFIEAGIGSVTVVYPILDQRKLDRLLSAASARGVDLRLVVDSQAGVDAIASAAARNAVSVPVFLEIDVGLHRCGLREEDPNLLSLVHRITDDSQLEFSGLLSHAGHAYAAKSSAEVRAIAEDERLILQRVRQSIEKSGVAVREVSVGATPTAIVSESYSGITEIRPGNYVFMDLTPVRLGLIGAERLALSVAATVVSMNQDYFIVDAGSKVLSSDLGAHGTGGTAGYGVAYSVNDYATRSSPVPVVRLSEEHGWLKRTESNLTIGSRVRILPNHACPVANLAASFIVLQSETPDVLRWPIEARGRVH